MRGARHPRLAAAFGLVAACWLLALALWGADQSALYFLPAVLLLVPLLAGRYVGEDAFARVLARARRPRLAIRPSPPPRRHRRSRRRRAAGGELIATRLAGRAPPRPA